MAKLPENDGSMQVGRVNVPCTIYPGFFDGEYQVTLEIPRLGRVGLFVSASLVDTKGKTPTAEGVPGTISVDLVAAEGDRIILELPGDTVQVGPRVQVPVTFIQQLA
ncbi:MAG: hypothetical protein ACE5IZ_06425 [Dehalococcoidia bacterium]